jgi:hypothetical protein
MAFKNFLGNDESTSMCEFPVLACNSSSSLWTSHRDRGQGHIDAVLEKPDLGASQAVLCQVARKPVLCAPAAATVDWFAAAQTAGASPIDRQGDLEVADASSLRPPLQRFDLRESPFFLLHGSEPEGGGSACESISRTRLRHQSAARADSEETPKREAA